MRSAKTFHLSLPCTSHLPNEIAADEMNGHFTSICQTLPPLSTASLPAYSQLRNDITQISSPSQTGQQQSVVLQGKFTVRSGKTFHLSLPCTSHLPSEIAAEEINFHFTSICQTLPPLSTASLPAYIPSPSTPHAVHEANVVSRIRIFKCNRATTPTGLPIKIYKDFAL